MVSRRVALEAMARWATDEELRSAIARGSREPLPTLKTKEQVLDAMERLYGKYCLAPLRTYVRAKTDEGRFDTLECGHVLPAIRSKSRRRYCPKCANRRSR